MTKAKSKARSGKNRLPTRNRLTAMPEDRLRPRPVNTPDLTKPTSNLVSLFKECVALPENPNLSKEHMVQIYLKQARTFRQMQRQLDNLLQLAAIAAIQGQHRLADDTTALLHAMHGEAKRVAESVQLKLNLPRSPLSAEFVAKNTPMQLHGLLENHLMNQCQILAQGFTRALEHALDNQLFGIVTWYGDRELAIRFSTRLIIDEQSENGRETATNYGQWQQTGTNTYQRTVTTKAQKTTAGTHIYRHICHQHEVIGGQRLPFPVASNYPMPPRARIVAQAIPSWLYPAVNLITGDMIRETTIGRDVKKQRYRNKSEQTEEHVLEQEMLHVDPAIALGDIVLFAWGSEEPVVSRPIWLNSLLNMFA